MRKIILITGGQRSGKSKKAEELALSLSPEPVYMATAHVWDDEFRERVRRHQERRGPQWTNIEEEMHLSRHDMTGRVVVIDCVTLWLTNFFFQNGSDADLSLRQAKEEFEAFTLPDATYIFVTNEIGLGGISADALQRKFTDLQGWMNQYIAEKADEVILMVSGIETKLKTPTPSPGRGEFCCENLSSSGERVGEGAAKTFHIQPVCRKMQAEIQEKIDNLNKPKGSLGRLEEVAMQVCLIQQTLSPSLAHPCHLLLGGDHGIEREGVSVSPREVTWQQMINFTRGGGGVNMFCHQHGFKLRIVDVGVDYDFSTPSITDRKIARGTRNFLYEPAMSEEEFDRAICIGSDLVDDCIAEGCRVLSIGEMGIGNTSPSSIWMHLFGGIPLAECIGAGSGLADAGIRHKYEVLAKAVERFRVKSEELRVKNKSNYSDGEGNSSLFTLHSSLAYFGGFEMVAAIGAMLRAAEQHLLILVDGFIMTACAIAAIRLYPAAQDYMLFTHCGDESGHKRMLDIVGAKPLLHLGLRLGEGTGALCAFPIVDSAVRMMNEMNNFDNAKITKYF